MITLKQHSYNLRKRHYKQENLLDEDSVETKQICKLDTTAVLPDEMLLHIFSFLTVEDLYFNIRHVCQRWCRLSKVASSWKTLVADDKFSSHVLLDCIKFSPVIKHIQICNRYDADIILNAVSKYLNQLESIVVQNCNGSAENVYIQSTILCKLVIRCKKLGKIILDNVDIRSCKFFDLLVKRKNDGKFVQLDYAGPLTAAQYKTVMDYKMLNYIYKNDSGYMFILNLTS